MILTFMIAIIILMKKKKVAIWFDYISIESSGILEFSDISGNDVLEEFEEKDKKNEPYTSTIGFNEGSRF